MSVKLLQSMKSIKPRKLELTFNVSKRNIDITGILFLLFVMLDMYIILLTSLDSNTHDNNNTIRATTIAGSRRSTLTGKPSVEVTDYIYSDKYTNWNGPPIVIEEYKLLFFTIPKNGCTVWKILFRRMMHYSNWNNFTIETQDDDAYHRPRRNGLRYLSDYPLHNATEMMTSSEWTRAIFVRDPKERFVSAYIDKMVNQENYIKYLYKRDKCVTYEESVQAKTQPEVFLKTIIPKCYDEHWRKQSLRIDDKFWPYINFVGNMNTLSSDAELLLRKLGVWELYGSNGWGRKKRDENSNNRTDIIDDNIFSSRQSMGRNHSSNATNKLKRIITTSKFENEIETYFASDYDHPLLKLPLKRIL
jgi:Sulfotransferase family